MEFPEDKDSKIYKTIDYCKEFKTHEKLALKDFNFEGARLNRVDFSKENIYQDLNFYGSIIIKYANFDAAIINGNIYFNKAQIGAGEDLVDDEDFKIHLGMALKLGNAYIKKSVFLSGATINGDIDFTCLNIKEFLYIDQRADIMGTCWFYGTQIGKYPSFENSKIEGYIFFKDSNLGYSDTFWGEHQGYNIFRNIEAPDELIIENTTFGDLATQEKALRKAKVIYKNFEDFSMADNYFYQEMVSEWKQKGIIDKFTELPIRYILRYGTTWRWILITWLATIIFFALLFWIYDGVENADSFYECLYFSFGVATTPGYSEFQPRAGKFQLVTIFETIIGTFLWGSVIAVIARKYMR